MARPKRLQGEALTERVTALTGHRFENSDLLRRALTHSSMRGKMKADYEQLEFLGDRVLGLTIAEMLTKTFPDAREGELALRLNALVSGEACAEIAEASGLTELIFADINLKALQGAKAHNVRADVVESLIAALYLDGGLDAVRPFVEKFWAERMRGADTAPREAKTALQEWAVQQGGAVPTYEVESRSGPDHDPVFTVAVSIPGFAPASATGASKRKAEQAAATLVLRREGVWPEAESS